LLAPAAALLSWTCMEWIVRGKPSALGAASGMVVGLVAITPAAGYVGIMGALIIGLVAGVAGLWGVTWLKNLLGIDDALDVFGLHVVGGLVGMVLTGLLNAQARGGPGVVTDWVAVTVGSLPLVDQVWAQFKAVLLTVVWSGGSALIAFKTADLVVGLRVEQWEEREGLDVGSHGERAHDQ